MYFSGSSEDAKGFKNDVVLTNDVVLKNDVVLTNDVVLKNDVVLTNDVVLQLLFLLLPLTGRLRMRQNV